MKRFINAKARRAERQEMIKMLFFVIVISAVLIVGIHHIGNMGNEQGIKLTREAVVRTVVECYAIEGIYPPNEQYMVDNYNLSYDETKYYIHYDAFASNIMPTVEVYEKR
nr:hypothetical protein [uncultured Catonella sp.]